MRHSGHVVVLPLAEQFYRDDHLFVQLRHKVVLLDGEAITLTHMEYRLLGVVVEHAGEAVPQASIAMQFCGFSPRRTRAGWLFTWVGCERN